MKHDVEMEALISDINKTKKADLIKHNRALWNQIIMREAYIKRLDRENNDLFKQGVALHALRAESDAVRAENGVLRENLGLLRSENKALSVELNRCSHAQVKIK